MNILSILYLLGSQLSVVFPSQYVNMNMDTDSDISVDTNLIQTSVEIAQLSYCPYIDYDYIDNTFSDNTVVSNIEQNGVRSIVGFNAKYNSIFVSYRGSTNIINWINNVRIRITYPFDFNLDAGVETGFYNSYKNVYDEVIENIHYTSEMFGVYDVLLTGHSLGSISTILAVDLTQYYKQYNIIGLVTFGSPRIGNDAFVELINSLPIGYHYRVVHNDDVVPHLPPFKLGYNHVETEIWYNLDNSQYTICLDPTKCYSSCGNNTCLNTDDHMNYLNVSMGSYGDCYD